MGANSKIAWTKNTFNPWIGCTKVSPACDHCYAERDNNRFYHGVNWGPNAPRRVTSEAKWREPRTWNRQAEREGKRFYVFCASWADVFDNQAPVGVRDRLWSLISETPLLDWLLLTKRPQNVAKMLPSDWNGGYPNVWLGATVENQVEARRRIPYLLAVPSVVHFLSCEPLLEQIDLAPWLSELDWIICGGESGTGARLMQPTWARSLRDQCKAAGAAFFFKQIGDRHEGWPHGLPRGKVEDIEMFPDDLKIREYPR